MYKTGNKTLQLSWLLLLAVMLSSGCAATTPGSGKGQEDVFSGAPAESRLIRIDVEKSTGGAERLTVETTVPVNSTAFLASNPLRLDLDLSGIDGGVLPPQPTVRSGLIKKVSATRLADSKILRIEAELLRPVSFEVTRQGKQILVELKETGAGFADGSVGNGGSPGLSKAKLVSDGEEQPRIQTAQGETPQAPASTQEKTEPKKEPSTEEAATEKQYTGARISLDFQDADLIGVLRLIAEVSGLNVITTPEVSGKLSLRLINVPWDQALDIILKNASLSMVREGNVVRIAPKTRLAQEREETLRAQKSEQQAEELVTRIVPVSYADTKELVSNVKPLLTDRGTVQVDSRTNTLIIKDVERVLGDVTHLIKTLDRQTPQVSIEAKVVEVNREFSRELGIQWGGTYVNRYSANNTRFPRSAVITGGAGPGGAGAANVGGVSPGIQGSDVSGSLGASPVGGNYVVNLPATSVGPGAGGALGIVLGSPTLDPYVLAAQLSAAESTGKGRILSNPKITTLDNKEASIEQGSSIPYQTTSASGTQTQFVDATLKLTVTPHITAENTVSMKIKVTKNAPNTAISVGGAPSIDKKEATTEVLVRDGETTVIGGIFTNDQSEAINQVPGLGDIPILGWLFKNQKKQDNSTELLIFITPRIARSQ